MFKQGLILSCASASLLLAGAATAENNPYIQPDDSWLSLSGTAVDISAEGFMLDFGDGVVQVEMDDWDWYNESRQVLEGDKVTVYGEVDDDLFETTSIEASSVYVENLGTFFYASTADEETAEDFDLSPTVPIEDGDLMLTGTITGTMGREFVIDSGLQEITVDTTQMEYNPLDDKGFQRLDRGDSVTVVGHLDNELFVNQELMAEAIISLEDERTDL